MELVKVPKVCFQMGSSYGNSDENPVHKVCITNPFYLGKYEVTQVQWQAIMGNNPSDFKKGNNLPVKQVSWSNIQTFLAELNIKTGKNYRLPTEAEWEYACRSGGKEHKYCGGSSSDAYAWSKTNSEGRIHPVGQKSPNELGLYDMSGNVWEWVDDWYGENYYKSSPINDPKGLDGSYPYRVVRGGSFQEDILFLRSTNRGETFHLGKDFNIGFRLAKSF